MRQPRPAMLDTHVAVALFEGRLAGYSIAAKRLLDRAPLALSPAVLLELELLHEIGRLRLGARAISHHLVQSLDVRIAAEGFAEVAQVALDYGFTRDPFDRLIVAHAALLNAELLTLDRQLQAHYPRCLH